MSPASESVERNLKPVERPAAFLSALDGAMLKIVRILAYAGAAALAVTLLLVCANIALRPIGGGIRGAAELSGYVCALALGLTLPLSQINGSHIGGGVWNQKLPRPMRLTLDALVNLTCAALLIISGCEIYGVALYGLEMGDYIDGFEFSYFPMALALSLGLFLQGAAFIRNLAPLFARGGEKR